MANTGLQAARRRRKTLQEAVAMLLAIPLLLSGCGTFQPKTTTVRADNYFIHIISDYYSKAYLIESENGLILVDSGAQGNSGKILKVVAQIPNKKLRLIFITHAHFDHYASAKAIRKATGAPICIHQADAEFMKSGQTPLPKVRKSGYFIKLIFPIHELFRPTPKTEPDICAVDGYDLSSFGINAKIVHLPGHTPGSSILLLDEKLAFVGDLLAFRGKVQVQDVFADNWGGISESFNRLKALKPELVFPGHGGVFAGSRLDEVRVDPDNQFRRSANGQKPTVSH